MHAGNQSLLRKCIWASRCFVRHATCSAVGTGVPVLRFARCFSRDSETEFGQFNDFWKRQRFRRGKSFEIVRPGNVSPKRHVPSHITVPNTNPSAVPLSADRKVGVQLTKMRESCALARKILNLAGQNVRVGITTDELDRIAHETILDHNAYPSPLLYNGFPKSICTSVNNIVCHGIPDDRPLQDGDVISIDVTVFYNGYHGDCSDTYAVGNVDSTGHLLIKAARESRDAAIKECAPEKPLWIIGKKISEVARSYGFTVVPSFCGHGIGTYFHGPPDIFHFDNNFEGTMEEGMTFTIEPVISENCGSIVVLEDGWTATTINNCRAAQFEHTIVITENGAEILTQ